MRWGLLFFKTSFHHRGTENTENGKKQVFEFLCILCGENWFLLCSRKKQNPFKTVALGASAV
jgi:hypothetical protein